MKTITTLLVALICSPAFAQTFSAPKEVGNAEMIPFVVEDYEKGDQVTWRLLHPRGVKVKQLQTAQRIEFVVDPPVGYSGTVEVMCTVINWDTRKFHQDELTVKVGDPDDSNPFEPDDPPIDDDDEPEPEGYNGPNAFGVGQVSYDAAPGYSEDAAEVIRKAGEYLYGRPELKVIFTQDQQANKTEFNVNVWVAAEMKRKGLSGTEWTRWYNLVYEQISKNHESKQLTLRDWYAMFDEARAGLEARK